MEEIQKKIGRRMSYMMGPTMSFVLSLVGNVFATITSGRAFSVVGWLISFVISALISTFILGNLIPMKKLSDGAVNKLKLQQGKVPARMVGSIISACIYSPIIVAIMIAIAFNTNVKPAINNVENEIASTQQSLSEVQERVAKGESTDMATDQQAIGQLSGKLGGLRQARAQMPTYGKMYLNSIGISLVMSLLLSFFLQPIYLSLNFKHFGIDV